MPNCPANCTDINLVPNPPDQCVLTYRQRILSRIGFFGCDTVLPDPITDEAIQQMITDGIIVFSSEITNPAFGDPVKIDVAIRACAPPLRVTESRELTFEDRISVSFTDTTVSPATTDAYHDYAFHQDKVDKQGLMNVMLVFCDGDVIVPTMTDGGYMGSTMDSYISYQPPTSPGGQFIEFKRVSIVFQGDPLAYYTARPLFNYKTLGITL